MIEPVKPYVPFIKLPGASLKSADVDAFASVVGTYLPLVVRRWDYPYQDKMFTNDSGCIRLGDFTLLSTSGSAIHGIVEQKCESQLVLPYPEGIEAFTNDFTIEKRTYRFRDSCLFIPAARCQFQLNCSQCSGIIISFPPECLLPLAHTIAGPSFNPLPLRAMLSQPGILRRQGDPRRDRLQQLLMQTMAYAEQCLSIGGEINPMLRLDDLLGRLIVMLLLPDLLEPAKDDPLITERFPHQDLVNWLLAHLRDPIGLSDMEERSNYSRRSLQYAFKQHFGCGPMQWLRQQRLSRAKALLEDPLCQLTLREVSQSCGYLSQANFSRDFLERYGERPSRIKRRLRDQP
jgi:AraC-like DNA-binding protein